MGDGNISDQRWKAELEDRQKQRDFERYKFDKEQEQKARELEATSTQGLRLSAAQATVWAAVLTLLGGLAGGLIQWRSASDAEIRKAAGELEIEKEKSRTSIELDRHKFETTLILKAVESPDENERTRNLKFFLKAGFISDPEGKLAAIKPEEYPSSILSYSLYPQQNLSDPAFASFPKVLIDFLARYEGPKASANALANAQKVIEEKVKVPLDDNQRSALMSLIYEHGPVSFQLSNLLADINAGRFDRIEQDFLELAPKTAPLSERVRSRRSAEARLFLSSGEPKSPTHTEQ